MGGEREGSERTQLHVLNLLIKENSKNLSIIVRENVYQNRNDKY